MNLIRKLLGEFYATVIFTFTVFGSSNDPILVALAFWAGIQGTGFINPFHFNPLVQLSSVVHKRITHFLTEKDKHYLFYSIPTQMLGALVGALFAWWIYEPTFYFQPGSAYSVPQYFFAELIFSSHLILICIGVGQWSESRLIGLFAICGGITSGILTVGRISGACFNPTVCFMINFVHAMKTDGSEGLEYLWLYFVAPFVGAIVAIVLGIIIHPKPEEKKHVRVPTSNTDELDHGDSPHAKH